MKIVLLFTMLVFGLAANAQAVFQIKSPASIKGFYSFGYGDSSSLSWNNGVLSKKSITADLVLATGPDSLAGSTLLGNYTGKIAVVYRGVYGYAVKALNAQKAGAVAVVVINHGINAQTQKVDSLERFNLSGMLQGETSANATGLKVNIPIILLNLKDGSAISKVLRNKETVSAYLGKKLAYDNDLAIDWKYTFQPKYYTRNSMMTLEGEVADTFGFAMFNKGNLDQKNILCTAVITDSKNAIIYGDTIFYATRDVNNAVVPLTIKKGDTTNFIYFNKAFAPKYDLKAGQYKLTYEILNYDNNASNFDSIVEDYPVDNKMVSTFYVSDSLFSVVPLSTESITDPVTKKVNVYKDAADLYNLDKILPTKDLKFNAWSTCIVLKDANASRTEAKGLSFWALKADSTNPNALLKDEKVRIDFWEWNDAFSFRDTFMFNKSKNVALVDNFEYTFKDSLSIKYQHIKFDYPIKLEDNKKYAACVTALSTKLSLGYSAPSSVYYTSKMWDTPYLLGFLDATPYSSIFGYNYPNAMTIDLGKNTASLNELDELDRSLNIYPNPTSTSLGVNYTLDKSSDVSISVTDMSGKVVYSMKSSNTIVGSNVLNIDTRSFNNGMYVLNVVTDKSSTSRKFTVMH